METLDPLPGLLSEPPLNPKQNREKMLEIMLETFCVPATYILNTGVMSIHGSNRTTGMVVECGHAVTHAVPIYEGFALPSRRLDMGGQDLTDYMVKLMNEKGYSFRTHGERDIVRMMKESVFPTLPLHFT